MANTVAPSGVLEELRELLPELQERLGNPIPAFPAEELELLARRGVLGATVGNAACGNREMLLLLHTLGQANLVLGRVLEGHINALLLIDRFGTPEQKRRAIQDVGEHRIFGVWNTGPAGQPVLLPREGDCLELAGSKTFATGIDRIQRSIVTAALGPDHWQMCVLRLDEMNFTVERDSWQPMGMEASESFAVDFTGAEVLQTDLLGGANDYYAEPFFTGGAMRFSAVQLGAAHALLQFTRDFLRSAGRDRDPHQLARLGQMGVLVESGRLWVEEAARWLDDSDVSLMPVRAHMMRTATNRICMEVMQLAETCIGARGLLAPLPFARMLRDLQMYLQQAGADRALTVVGEAVTNGLLHAAR